jgi:uncharacterized protein YeeX (DUF496 family)
METVYQSKLTNISEGHVFYRFQDSESYIDHLVSFIKTGIDRRQLILIIDSMRNLPKIIAKINMLLTIEQQSTIRLVNNYDYYLSNGDFNTQTILTHFQKDLSLLKEHNSSIRTWSNVEWVSNETDAQLLKEFESQADDFVIKERMLSVCAYTTANLSSSLNEALEQVHKYVMTDDDFSLSTLYEKQNLIKIN